MLSGFMILAPNRAQADDPVKATYVGVEVCAGCHQTQAERWKTSHHALAMEKATPETVLGDFSGVSVENFGVVSTFSHVGDKFMVRTDGPDGALHDYEITHTFGIDPLQQYLIEFPDGRYQMLGLAWDTRPKDKGGQRWFHLYPDEKLKPGSLLHWTGRDQNWNYQCADCHTTDLKKNFDLSANAFATTWVSLGVTCEACHGPGARHVAWAKAGASQPNADKSGLPEKARTGLEAWLKATDHGKWEMNPGDWHRAPHRAIGFNADQRLRPLSFAKASARQGTGARRPVPRCGPAESAGAWTISCRRADRRRGI